MLSAAMLGETPQLFHGLAFALIVAGTSAPLLEAAPKEWRGGNSSHTRNLRAMHEGPQDVLLGTYTEEEYWDDLLRVTGGLMNENLARLVIRSSSSCRDWMMKHGVHFQAPLSGTLHLSCTNAYYRSAEKLGVQIRYESPVDSIEIKDGQFIAAYVGSERIEAKSCVLAAGGF